MENKEPKQDFGKPFVNTMPMFKRKPKQETLEEAAEKIYREYPNNPLDKPDWRYNRDVNCFKKRKAFIAGAKWLQERMYSKEDMMFAYEQGARLALISQSPLALHKGEFPTPKQWFEQFKKK
jgi:hypothetical protein